MSREYELRYEMERKRREEMERRQAAEYAENALKTFSREYEKMLQDEYEAYAPSEMSELKQNLEQIANLIKTDPLAARNLCHQTQPSVNRMAFVVQAAKEEFERQERIRLEELKRLREEAKSNLLKFFYERLKEIKNPAVANFSRNEVNEVKAKIEAGTLAGESEVREALSKIEGEASQKFENWKKEKLQNEKVALLKQSVESCIQDVENENFENVEKKKAIVGELNELKESISENSREEEIGGRIKEIYAKTNESLIDEAVRREMVKSIVKELRSQEFTVEKPQIFGQGKDSYVLVKAKKPSGKRALCKVNLEGKLSYKFDNYEGMTCLKDIEKFNVDLEKIYSVKLSDERILWENPDRLSRTQSASSAENVRNV